MDDDLGLELGDSFDDRDGSPAYRGRGRGRGRSGFRSSRGTERFSFKTRASRGFRGGGGRGSDRFVSGRGRGRGDGFRRGRGENRRGRGDGIRSTYNYESPRSGYKEREFENSREYVSDYRSPPSYNSLIENGYGGRGRRGNGRGPSRGGFATPRRGGLDHYGERSSYGGSYSAPKGARDYPDYPRRGYEDSYAYGREQKMDKYRDDRYPSRDFKYRGSPQYREEFRRSSPPSRRMSPPRRRMSPPPRRMSPPPRFRSRSPLMMRRSRSPIGRGDRFRGSSRGLRRPWTPPPPPRRERSRSPRYVDRGLPRNEFHNREHFRGAGGRGFRGPRDYPAPKPGFRPKGPYSGERY